MYVCVHLLVAGLLSPKCGSSVQLGVSITAGCKEAKLPDKAIVVRSLVHEESARDSGTFADTSEPLSLTVDFAIILSREFLFER